MSEKNEPKTLTIRFPEDGGMPSFDFTGEWAGRDVRVVWGHLRKAYYMRNRDIRRANIVETQEVDTNA